ncbi:hypothetical protein EG832_16915, partial [bacterium]|nr:hypothetical protein [bacterium]
MAKLQVNQLKTFPRWALTGGFTVGLILVVLLLILIASRMFPENPTVTITFVNGDVQISDGDRDTAAITGPLDTGYGQNLLKTGNGTAGLQLRDGSLVIVDSDSIIEFRQKNNNNPFQVFSVNLLKGRLLVVSEKT